MLNPSLRLCDKGTMLCEMVHLWNLSCTLQQCIPERPQLEFATSSPCDSACVQVRI